MAILAALSLVLAVVFALTLIVLLGLLAIGRFAVSWTRRRPALA